MSTYEIIDRRKDRAERIIQKRVAFATGLGLIPIPVIDVASIFGTQVLMIREIADLYEVPFEKHRLESFIGIMVGDLATTGVIKSIPGIGSVIGGVTLSVNAAAATYAIGKVFVEHFNQGGTLLDFDPESSRAYFQELYTEGVLNKESHGERRIKKKRSRLVWYLWLFILIWFGLVAGYVLLFWNNAIQPPIITEQYVQQELEEVVSVNAQKARDVVAESQDIFSEFRRGSTEARLLAHIQNGGSTYPVRLGLDAVQFEGSAVVMSSTGSLRQLENIASILKVYPRLSLQIYGQTNDIGNEIVRRRVGRERARDLREALIKYGIEGYRITGNPLELDPFPSQIEYWGAEMIVDLAPQEAVTHTENNNTF